MSKRNLREEIELALSGQAPEFVPFTCYPGYMPKGPQGQELMDRGMSLSTSAPIVRELTPNVNLKIEDLPDGTRRVTHQTPVGEVYKLVKLAAGGSWGILEFYIKKPEDYKVAEFIFKDRRYEPCYDEFLAAQAKLGDKGIVAAGAAASPLLELQLVWLGQELFCYDMADRFDDVMNLHEILWRNQQQIMPIVADSPAKYIKYCGNVVAEMLGLENVNRYVLPAFQAWAQCVHASGKKLGSHLDARNSLLLDFVPQSGLDFVEAFTPPPDCDVSVEQARAAWPGTVLWTNFPPSVHLKDRQTVKQTAAEMIRQSGDRKGFLMGITEDFPQELVYANYCAILEAINESRH